MNVAKMGHSLLDLVFPRRCVWCGKVIGFTAGDDCENQLAQIYLADAPLAVKDREGLEGFVQEVWACYRYEDPVKHTIWRLKFEKDELLALPLGDKLAEKAVACMLAQRYDVIVPVPVSAKTRRTRGFNQSALMAKRLAAQAGMRCEDRLLVKTVETQRQMDLGREARRTNVVGAFEVKDAAPIAGKRVLLVDDVVTTGSTLGESARMLLGAGATVCGALCMAAAG